MTTSTRIVLLVVVAPLAAAIASILALALLGPELPTQLAVHWGVDGVDRVDGLGSFVGLVAGLVPGFTAFMVVAAVLAIRAGTTRSHLRMLVGASTWFGVAVSAGAFGTALAQRGAPDAFAVPVSAALVPLLLAALAGGVLAAVTAALVPVIAEPVRTAGASATGIPLSPTESVHWSTTVHGSRASFAVLGGVMLFIIVVFAVAGLPWWASVLVFAVLLALSTMLGWHVTIDRRGLRATGLYGYPRIVVPAEKVLSATVVTVKPFGDFGGWGVRMDGRGRLGLIVRGGAAIEVERAGKQPLVITVPDAAAGAAVLASVATSRA